MEMSKRTEAISLICEFPIRLYQGPEAHKSKEGLSINEYREIITNKLKVLKKNLRIDEIIDYVKKNPNTVKKWDLYCMNKRGGSGYYFMINKTNYEFGFYDKSKNASYQILISEQPEYPCALFILYELEINKYFYL